MLRPLLLAVHLLAAVAWVGGMFFAYACLRPASAEVLEPAPRLRLWTATLARFLRFVGPGVALLLATGLALLAPVGLQRAPVGWHVMLVLGLVMAVVYAVVHGVLFARLRRHCEAGAWPEAAAALNGIRRLVGLNLVLGVVTLAAAVWSR